MQNVLSSALGKIMVGGVGLCGQHIEWAVAGKLLELLGLGPYESYWDVVKVGQYTFHIEELHKKYGPIIRIKPYKVHINDADFYDELNCSTSSGRKREKWPWLVDSFGVPHSVFTTVNHDTHRMRRAALNPFFSKTKVRALQSSIEYVFGRLLKRMEGYKTTNMTMPLGLAFTAVTYDVAGSYAFGTKDFRVDALDFAPAFHVASEKLAKQSHLMKQYPWLLSVSQRLPDKWVSAIDPDLAAIIRFQRSLQKQFKSIEEAYDSADYKAPTQTTIFHEILSSPHLPDHEKTHSRLWQDGQVVVVAGTVTTATNFSNMTYFLLTQPAIMKRLRDELLAVLPDKDSSLDLTKLENQPYLTAFITEALRYSNGFCTRAQRIHPDKPIVFTAKKDSKIAPASNDATYILPASTPISMTTMLIHRNPNIFSDPPAFDPSRWLDTDPITGRNFLHHRLDKFFLPFSKGTRACLGINLAWAELYLLVAMVFRRYGSQADQREGDDEYLEFGRVALSGTWRLWATGRRLS